MTTFKKICLDIWKQKSTKPKGNKVSTKNTKYVIILFSLIFIFIILYLLKMSD